MRALEIGTFMNPTSILAGVLVVAFAVAGWAKLAAVPAMRARAEHVGFSVPAYRRIGFLEVLAVLGLLAGAFVPVIWMLAGVGILFLLGGALVVHLRNGDGVREIVPAAVLGLVTLSFLILVVAGVR
jgi:DoxX-like family